MSARASGSGGARPRGFKRWSSAPRCISGDGQSSLAQLIRDGSETSIKGEADGSVVSAVREGGGYKLTFRRGGKVINEQSVTPSEGGTLAFVSFDPRDKSKVSWTARRQ